MADAPELPDDVREATKVEHAYTLELKDGSEYVMSGSDVLAVYMKYGPENWDRWVAAARDRIAEWYYDERIPARFSTRGLHEGETMADICEGPEDDGGALYYGDLRAAKMQLGFAALAAEEGEEPVTVVGLTGDGEREYADPAETLASQEGDG